MTSIPLRNAISSSPEGLKSLNELQYETMEFEPFHNRQTLQKFRRASNSTDDSLLHEFNTNGEAIVQNDAVHDHWLNTIVRWLCKCCSCLPISKWNALQKWVLTFLIGLLTAYVALFITYSFRFLSAWKFAWVTQLIEKEKNEAVMIGFAFLSYVFINSVFAGIASIIVCYVSPYASGSGIPEIKSFLNGARVADWMSFKTLLCKFFGVIFSISSGLPVGKEGPMIHSGAIIASLSSTYFFEKCRSCLSMHQKGKRENLQRDFVTCGAAAGVASAFGAPIGGVLFSLEEGASFLSPKLIWRSFFCAMVASFTLYGGSMLAYGDSWRENAQESIIFSFGRFADPDVNRANYMIWELLLFIIIGIWGGVFGAFFNFLNRKMFSFMHERKFAPFSRILHVIVLSILMSSVSYSLSFLFGACIQKPQPDLHWSNQKIDLSSKLIQFYCKKEEYNDLASLYLTQPETALKQLFHFSEKLNGEKFFSNSSLVCFFFTYLLGACCCFGSSVSSGIFVPCILSGAAIGRFLGALVHKESDSFADIGVYALVGAAAVLGGVTRMTISLTIILLEATGDLQYGLPLMMTFMTARWTGNVFNEGIYDIHIEIRKIPILDWDPPKHAKFTDLKSVINHAHSWIGKRESVGKLYDQLKSNNQQCFAVVERHFDETTGVYRNVLEGTILRNTIAGLLESKNTWNPFKCEDLESDHTSQTEKQTSDDFSEKVKFEDIDLSENDRNFFINLEYYVNPAPFLINVEASADQAYRLFRTLGLSFMCVVTKQGELVGVITRDDFVRLNEQTIM